MQEAERRTLFPAGQSSPRSAPVNVVQGRSARRARGPWRIWLPVVVTCAAASLLLMVRFLCSGRRCRGARTTGPIVWKLRSIVSDHNALGVANNQP